jgi:hypothetical protein
MFAGPVRLMRAVLGKSVRGPGWRLGSCGGMETLDSILFWLELVLVPTSLGLLIAASGSAKSRPPWWLMIVGLLTITACLGSVWYLIVVIPAAGLVAAVAWLAHSRPRMRRFAVPLTVIAALTVAQPFGVHDEPILTAQLSASPQQPWTGGESVDPTSTRSADLLGLPVLRFQLYRRDRFDPLAGLGECCPPTHDLRIRSWIPPALMTNGSNIFGLCGDSPCWDPDDPSTDGVVQLIRKGDSWYTVIKSHGVTYAWRLKGGVTSRAGVLYWVLAALGIGSLVYRRARL